MPELKKYIDLTTMMVVATIDEEGKPYTANVYFKYDEENNKFYFKSKDFREHSKHIKANSNVAWSVLNSEKYTSSDKDKKGLQFQGTAKMLMGKESESIFEKMYGIKRNFIDTMREGHYIFECTPKKVKVWDEEIYGGRGKVFEL